MRWRRLLGGRRRRGGAATTSAAAGQPTSAQPPPAPPPCHRAGAGGGNGNDRPGSNPAARGYFGGPPAATQASQTISLGMQRRYQDGGFTWPSRAVGGGVCTHRVVAAPPVGATQQVERAAVEGEAPGRPRRLSDRPVAATPSPATAGSGQVTGRGGGGGGREVAAPAWPPAARTRSRLVDFPSRYFIRSAHHTRGTACGFDATHWPRGSVIDFKGQSSQCHIGVLHTKHILALTSCQHGGEVSFPDESRAEGLPRFIGCRRTES